jgi:hypothetical protein
MRSGSNLVRILPNTDSFRDSPTRWKMLNPKRVSNFSMRPLIMIISVTVYSLRFPKLAKARKHFPQSQIHKFANLKQFVGFADLPQMWHLANLRFLNPSIVVICRFVICGLAICRSKLFSRLKTCATPHIQTFSPNKYSI